MRLQKLQFFTLWVMASTLYSTAQTPVRWVKDLDISSPKRPLKSFGHLMWTAPSGVSDSIYVYGGICGDNTFTVCQAVWKLSTTTWQWTPLRSEGDTVPSGIGQRSFASGAYRGNELYISGGHHLELPNSYITNQIDRITWDPNSFILSRPNMPTSGLSGQPLTERVGHSLSYFPSYDRLYLFGGAACGLPCTFEGPPISEHLWASGSNTTGLSFSNVAAPNPQPRKFHTAVVIGNLIYYIGGLIGSGGNHLLAPDIEKFDPFLDSWATVALDGYEARWGQSAVVFNNKAYLFGGRRQLGGLYTNLMFEFEPSVPSYTPVTLAGPAPSSRSFQSMVLVEPQPGCRQIVVFGGQTSSTPSHTATQLLPGFDNVPGGNRLNDVHTLLFEDPSVTSLSGCVADFPNVKQCAQAGGATLAINGNDLSAPSATVTVGGISCPITSRGQTQIQCTLPPAPMINAPVVVNICGRTINAGSATYLFARLTPGTLHLVGSTQPPGSVILPDTAGGQRISFEGQDFDASLSVFYGTDINDARFQCAIQILNLTYVECEVTAGVGGNLKLILIVGGSRFMSTDTISYPLFSLVPYGAHVEGFPPSPIGRLQLQTTRGDPLVLPGANFGNDPTVISVTYGRTGVEFTCGQVSILTSPVAIRCITSPTSEEDVWQVRVAVLGAFDFYNGTIQNPGAPRITGVFGCLNQTGNETFNCPTAGNIPITLRGRDFLPGMSVTVDGLDCSFVQVINSGEVQCILPESAGLSRNVIIQNVEASIFSPASRQLSYAKPVINGVTGCPTYPLGCNRLGGDTITITGENLGKPTATVLVGGNICTNVTHGNGILRHKRVTCQIPAGKGSNVLVMLVQAAGEVSSGSTASINYYACKPGEYDDQSGTSCLACARGTYALNFAQIQCNPCDAGTYANTTSLSGCYQCPAGTEAITTSLTVCTECTPGRFQEAPGSANCRQCDAGRYASRPGMTACDQCGMFSYSAAGAGNCSTCDDFAYTTQLGSTSCTSCETDQYYIGREAVGQYQCLKCPGKGAQCSKGFITPLQGYWFARDSNSGEIQTFECPETYCEANGVCGPNRISPASINPLCGKCQEGFYEWSRTCVQCGELSSYIGYIMAIVVACWFYVLLFHHVIVRTTRGETKIFLYFVQMGLVFIGSERPWIGWMTTFDFNLFDQGAVCVAPIPPLAKLFLGLLVPVFCMVQLILTMLIRATIWWCRYGRRKAVDDKGRRRKFYKSPYFRTFVGLFIFSFNSVTVACLKYFNCIKVGEYNVIATAPAISCDSADYQGLLVIAIAVMAFFILGVPFGMWILLYRAHKNKHLENDKFISRYGVLFETYKAKYWWWDVYAIMRRVCLIATGVIWNTTSVRTTRFSSASFINLCFFLAHVWFLPFKYREDNILEGASLGVLLIFTIFLGQTTVPFSVADDWAFGTIFLSMTFGLLCWMIWLRWKLRKKLEPEDEVEWEGPDMGMSRRATLSTHLVEGGGSSSPRSRPSPGTGTGSGNAIAIGMNDPNPLPPVIPADLQGQVGQQHGDQGIGMASLGVSAAMTPPPVTDDPGMAPMAPPAHGDGSGGDNTTGGPLPMAPPMV